MQGIFSQRLEDLLGGLSELANEEACENDVVWAARTAVLVQQFQVTINHFCFQKSPLSLFFFFFFLFLNVFLHKNLTNVTDMPYR